jgi:hypothetical protein
MVQSTTMNQFIREGSGIKTGRILVLLVLAIGLLAGPWQAPAGAEMLGRVQQMRSLNYSSSSPNWYETKPDGTVVLFNLAPGQSFVMTAFRGRFYADNPATDTGPYRLYLLGPNLSSIYVANMTDFMYPGSATVSGGTLVELNLQPGYVFIAPPPLRKCAKSLHPRTIPTQGLSATARSF